MLDTIRVKYPILLTPEQLEGWTRRETTSPTGKRESYIYNPVGADQQVLPRYTYFPLAYDGNPMLTLEVSLPKLLFDNNYQMLPSIDGTVKLANVLLQDIPHVPNLDLGEGILIRLDMCYNHQVGDAVEDYVRAIGNLDYPHRNTKHHRYQGVEFRSKHKTTKFYNKERESGFIEAHGILRQETTLLNRKDVQKFTAKPKPTLLDVSFEALAEAMKDDLRKLGLFENSIATRDTALKTLSEAYGDNAGIYYFGLLSSKLNKSRKEIGRNTGTHPRSLDRKLRNIVDAGMPLTLTQRDQPLPPLVIELS